MQSFAVGVGQGDVDHELVHGLKTDQVLLRWPAGLHLVHVLSPEDEPEKCDDSDGHQAAAGCRRRAALCCHGNLHKSCRRTDIEYEECAREGHGSNEGNTGAVEPSATNPERKSH